MKRLVRVAEEEPVLLILLAGFAVVFLSIFPPHLLVNDSFLTLAAGREVAQHGLPTSDSSRSWARAQTWTDQQWGAQLLAYGAFELGGLAVLAIVTAVFVVGAFVLAAIGARSLGAGPRADRARLLSGHPRRALGLDDPGPGLRPPLLHGARVVARERSAPPVPQRLPRDPHPRRVGEPPRQRCARRTPDDGPRRDRARLRAEVARSVAVHRCSSSRRSRCSQRRMARSTPRATTGS